MANAFSVSVDVDAPAGVAWQVAGDPAGVPRWYTAYESCTVDGDRRVLRRAGGAEVVERLVARDDARRSYSYSVVAGVPVTDHLASIEVEDTGRGSRVVWRTSATPRNPDADLEALLAGRQRAALEVLKELIEETARSGA
ncbi:MAG: SRPBCC family protein [Actinomycetota bacterium]